MRWHLLLLTTWGLLPAVACAQTQGGDPTLSPEAVVRAHLDAENAHDVDRILATLAERVEMRVRRPGQGDTTYVLTGAELRRNYERAVRNAPQSRFHVLERVVSGPIVVTREEATGLPGGAREVGLTLYRVERGRIVALWILNTEGLTVGAVTSAGKGRRAASAPRSRVATAPAPHDGSLQQGSQPMSRTSRSAESQSGLIATFAERAAAKDIDGLVSMFSEAPVRATGEGALRSYLLDYVAPFFADMQRVDSYEHVNGASFEDGSVGVLHYAYIETSSGSHRPFMIAIREEGERLRVMNIEVDRCVKGRHPVTEGRCDK